MEKLTIQELSRYKRCSRQAIYDNISNFDVIYHYGTRKILVNEKVKNWKPKNTRRLRIRVIGKSGSILEFSTLNEALKVFREKDLQLISQENRTRTFKLFT